METIIVRVLFNRFISHIIHVVKLFITLSECEESVFWCFELATFVQESLRLELMRLIPVPRIVMDEVVADNQVSSLF